MNADRERLGQKLRTRRDLLSAARKLVDRGTDVTLAAVADEAGISRATAYRYFSDPAALALEAVLDDAAQPKVDILIAGAPVRERVQAVRRYWHGFYRSAENRVRILAARAMEPGPEGAPRFRRSARRLPMYAEAIAPAAQALGAARSEDLALSLTAVSGFETWVAMKDVLQLDDERIEALSATILDAILQRFGIADCPLADRQDSAQG